jgi:hypothetical protein
MKVILSERGKKLILYKNYVIVEIYVIGRVQKTIVMQNAMPPTRVILLIL